MRSYTSLALKLSAISLALFLLHQWSPVWRLEQVLLSSPRSFFAILPYQLGARFSLVASFFSDLPHLRQELSLLREENLSLRSQVASLKEETYRLSVLEKELQLFRSLDSTTGLVEAHPVKVEHFPSGRYVFTVDKGSLAGVRVDSPVSFQSFLLGRVSQVSPRSAVVSSVWDSEFATTCFDQDVPSRLEGICSAEGGALRFSSLEPGIELSIGDVILSSGRDGFPRGRILGKVSKIEGGLHQLSRYAVVETYLSRLPDTVFVEVLPPAE